MNAETITKESDTSGVYFRRVVHDVSGNVVSDERVKRDPVLTFTQPEPTTLDEITGLTVVSVSFQLRDFDGDARTDSGEVRFRLQDRSAPADEGVVFTRQLLGGALVLTLEMDAPGEYVLTIEPPLVADMQLPEPVRVKVE